MGFLYWKDRIAPRVLEIVKTNENTIQTDNKNPISGLYPEPVMELRVSGIVIKIKKRIPLKKPTIIPNLIESNELFSRMKNNGIIKNGNARMTKPRLDDIWSTYSFKKFI